MIKKHKIKIGIITIAAIIAALNTVDLNALFAAGTSSPYDNSNLTVFDIEKLYHKRINDIFNAKLKLLNEGAKGSGTAKVPDGDDCPENNYSTYCVAVSAVKEYEQFKTALTNRKPYIEIGEEGMSLEQATTQLSSKMNEIDREIVRAKSALDSALRGYNELRIAYPMHLKYLETIKNLTEYNKKLINLRKEVEKLPGKFIDASTAQCK